jgi:type II secretory ATPase GspE/PulE/Tfp pilus assembly ATPase PilB-like protein
MTVTNDSVSVPPASAFSRVGDVVVALKLATRDEVEAALADKPEGVRAIEWLGQKLPAVAAQAARVLTLHEGLTYVDSFDGLTPHPLLATRADLRAQCDRVGAMVFSLGHGALVVFGEYENLRRYRQMGQEQRLRDPIYSALSDQPITLACGERVRLIQQLRDMEADRPRDQVEFVDNVWMSTDVQSDAQRRLARILDDAILRDGTDVALVPLRNGRVQVAYRRHGRMRLAEELDHATAEEITHFLLAKSRANPTGGRLFTPRNGQLVFRGAAGEVFVRASFIPADRGGVSYDLISVSLRLLPRSVKTLSLADLHLPAPFIEAALKQLQYSQGLVVLAGPTNSGKSTTIAALVGEHLRMFGNTQKRLSIEDPVERYLEGITQISVPTHLEDGFAVIFADVLRHDPDLIWIGEVREPRTALTCVRAASSGHMVFTTLHANDTLTAYKALANMVDESRRFDLVESLAMIVGQRLVQRVCPHCSRNNEEPTPAERESFGYYVRMHGLAAQLPERVVHARKEGCDRCSYEGYAGVVPLLEVLPVTREVKNALLASVTPNFDDIARHRILTLFESGMQRVQAGEIELGEALV